MRWVIGDGQSINIATDRWLRSKKDFCVDREQLDDQVLQKKVCDFFQENTRKWDEHKVRLHFNREDADAILSTRIPQGRTRDRIAWLHSSNGKYTVKSGYHQWCQSHLAIEEVQQSNGWNRLWNLGIPHKVRVFLWRFCRNTLPIRILLRGRGVPAPLSCSKCIGEVEHLRHVFFECRFARECWQQTGIRYDLWDIETSHEWLLEKLAVGSTEELIKISIVLWGIWFARNKTIFESKNMTPTAVVKWSEKQVLDWKLANKKDRTTTGVNEGRQDTTTKWHQPAPGSLKLNVDASVTEGQNSFSLGMVIRNHQGDYIAGKVMRCVGRVPALEAELTGVAEALVWAQEVADGEVEIESDSLLAVNALKNNQDNLLEFGDLVQQCKASLEVNKRFKVSFVRRQANQVAHRIARIPCELSSFIVIPSPPSCLLETLLSDILI